MKPKTPSTKKKQQHAITIEKKIFRIISKFIAGNVGKPLGFWNGKSPFHNLYV
jgi:hypothetical protein